MQDYLEATRGLELAKSVHLEADVDEPYMLGETKYILSLADQDNPLTGVVACCRPEKATFKAYLDEIVGHPRLKGLRRILHTQPDELSETPLFAQNVRLLENYGLSFDICVLARQLPLAIRLVKECPGVSFILDHCGNPHHGTNDLTGWQRGLAKVANTRNRNVMCNPNPYQSGAHAAALELARAISRLDTPGVELANK